VHSDRQIDQIRQSLRDYGWTTAVLVDEEGRLIAGHGRVEAARREGQTEVPVIVASGWTEMQCRAYALADNRIPLNASWDAAALGVELGELSGLGVDLGTLGFDDQEIGAVVNAGTEGLTDPDEVPEAPVQAVSRAGDVWLLGKHRILCGDSTVAADVVKVLGAVKPHLMVTDPPYGVEYDPNWRNGTVARSDGWPLRAAVIGGRRSARF
jgi:ParB-like chromosome segregation protein Spo0J